MLNMLTPCSQRQLHEATMHPPRTRKGDARPCTLMPFLERSHSNINTCVERCSTLLLRSLLALAATLIPRWEHARKHHIPVPPLSLTDVLLCVCAQSCCQCSFEDGHHCRPVRGLSMLSAVCFTRPHGLTKRSYLLVSTRQHLLSLCSRTLLVMYGQALTTKHMPQVSTRVKLLLCLSIP